MARIFSRESSIPELHPIDFLPILIVSDTSYIVVDCSYHVPAPEEGEYVASGGRLFRLMNLWIFSSGTISPRSLKLSPGLSGSITFRRCRLRTIASISRLEMFFLTFHVWRIDLYCRTLLHINKVVRKIHQKYTYVAWNPNSSKRLRRTCSKVFLSRT